MGEQIRFAIERYGPNEIIIREHKSRALLSCKIVARQIEEILVIEGRMDIALFNAAQKYAQMCGRNWSILD